MCVYLYIHNKYTQHTCIYYENKNLFWMRLIAIYQSFDNTNENILKLWLFTDHLRWSGTVYLNNEELQLVFLYSNIIFLQRTWNIMHTSYRIFLCYFFFFFGPQPWSVWAVVEDSPKMVLFVSWKNKSIRQPVIVGSLTEAETTDNHHSNVYTHKMSSVWLPVWVQCFSNWGVRVTLHSCCDGKVRNVFVLKCLKKSSWKNFKEDILNRSFAT